MERPCKLGSRLSGHALIICCSGSFFCSTGSERVSGRGGRFSTVDHVIFEDRLSPPSGHDSSGAARTRSWVGHITFRGSPPLAGSAADLFTPGYGCCCGVRVSCGRCHFERAFGSTPMPRRNCELARQRRHDSSRRLALARERPIAAMRRSCADPRVVAIFGEVSAANSF